MPKLERLLQLARLIKERRVVSVEEMRLACGVSDRTIYRYLNVLGRLDLLSPGRERTTASRSGGTRGNSLRATDLELLSFVLAHNPLVGFRYFGRRLDTVKTFLEELIGPLPASSAISITERGGSIKPGGSQAEAVLDAFFQARAVSAKVRLKLKGRRGPGKVYKPRGIEISGPRLSLLVNEPGHSEIIAVDLERVAQAEGVR